MHGCMFPEGLLVVAEWLKIHQALQVLDYGFYKLFSFCYVEHRWFRYTCQLWLLGQKVSFNTDPHDGGEVGFIK